MSTVNRLQPPYASARGYDISMVVEHRIYFKTGFCHRKM